MPERLQRLRVAARGDEVPGSEIPCRREGRIQIDGAGGAGSGRPPAPRVECVNDGERYLALRQTGVEGYGMSRRLLGELERARWSRRANPRENAVCVGETGIGAGVRRV